MNGGNNQQQNTSSLREEIAKILPQQNQVSKPPGQVPAAPPKPAPEAKKPESVSKFILRTLTSDLENLQKGRVPSGLEVEKSGKIAPRPSPVMPPPPRIQLGPMEKAAPITPSAPREKIALPPRLEQPARVAPPPSAPPKKKKNIFPVIAVALAMALVAYGLVYLVFLKEAEEPLPSPTPTPTPLILSPLEEVFGKIVSNIIVTSTETHPIGVVQDEIDVQLIDIGETKAFKFINEKSEKYDFREVMELLKISLPLELNNALNKAEYAFLIYGQAEEFDSQGNLVVTTGTSARFKRVGFVVRIENVIVTRDSLAAWETTLDDALAEIFDLGGKTASSTVFNTNTYNGVGIRYKNFPYPDLSVDYAIVSSFNGQNYLLITNSRESIYASVDKLLRFLAE